MRSAPKTISGGGAEVPRRAQRHRHVRGGASSVSGSCRRPTAVRGVGAVLAFLLRGQSFQVVVNLNAVDGGNAQSPKVGNMGEQASGHLAEARAAGGRPRKKKCRRHSKRSRRGHSR